MKKEKTKIILSGGGTGGHIYPAVAVAEALKRKMGDGVELLFVGAQGKMEMEKVPALGYRIVGLPIAGLQRRLDVRNLLLPFKVAGSLRRARRVVKDFGADAVAGFGGYASMPVLRSAQGLGIPTLIQEQNSFAGKTNKMLAKRARTVCVAYDNMDKFFPTEKIVFTGNPMRGNFSTVPSRAESAAWFGLSPEKRTILVVGGSLGTRTLNNMMKRWADELGGDAGIQVIWQTGKYYEGEIKEFMADRPHTNIWYGAFIDRMDYAYSAADVVISRAGAGTVSELCAAGKPVIFVPSPNVAEDHQTKNAMALVEKDAAMMVSDELAVHEVIPAALQLLSDKQHMETLAANISKLAIPDSADRVANEILKLIGEADC